MTSLKGWDFLPSFESASSDAAAGSAPGDGRASSPRAPVLATLCVSLVGPSFLCKSGSSVELGAGYGVDVSSERSCWLPRQESLLGLGNACAGCALKHPCQHLVQGWAPRGPHWNQTSPCSAGCRWSPPELVSAKWLKADI